ncbi:UDP-N-acetylglucosamine 2-epimerase [Halosimplex pelagicum]|uniref:UDP-N-acetylglucosamine 2-epimerase (Hydrolyzing) n=1 Tax=Halosimplex pelagicum TaxID=869886 RepID=A0A7D5TAA0_9EURY|nr:UDP-N-acetylglucosamine 2-epimerase [Halosimplex pelagicum]QLH81209.1 UDP-N-acetylglucosamine 2-epimerase (hydrolyzing) [Halosimplex pelagicum]
MTTNIAVVTGTRAEPLRSTMRAIEATDGLSLSIVATGMHLSPQHGMTVEELREQGFTVDREIHMLLEGDSSKAMAKSLGIGISSLAEAFESLDTDLTVVIGDRDEGLAGALASAHMNIPVAHIHGGDVMSGSIIDDSIRHAITKFAHVHFPAIEQYADNIEKLGEEPWRITVVGSPGLDAILAGEYTPYEDILEKYDLDPSEPLALVVQHPLTTEPENAPSQMETTLSALEDFNGNIVVIYSNADSGGKRMIEVIDVWKEFRTDDSTVKIFKSLPREEYLGVMQGANVMIGNSSSGVVEAPSFDLPVVDIGPRQVGRVRADNTISVGYDVEEIKGAIDTCLYDDDFRERVKDCSNPYYRGGAGEQITERLASLSIDDRLLRKKTTY